MSALSQAVDDPEDLLEDERGEAERGLVEQHEARSQEQGAPHLEHLLLSAREIGGALVAGLAEHREDLVDAFDVALEGGRARPDVGPEEQVLLDGHEGKDVPALRDVRDPAAEQFGRGLVRHVLAGEADSPLTDGQEPEERLEDRGFTSAVGADDRDDLPGLDSQRHAPEDLHLPVTGVDVLDLEQGHRLPPEVRVDRPASQGSLILNTS